MLKQGTVIWYDRALYNVYYRYFFENEPFQKKQCLREFWLFELMFYGPIRAMSSTVS